MQVTVKFMAAYKLAIGADKTTVSLMDGSTVKDLVEVLCAQYKGFKPDPKSMSMLLNQNRAIWTDELHDGDELYIINQLGGG